MSPQIQGIKYKKKFFSTNNNFKNPQTPFNKNKERNIYEKKEILTLSNTNNNIEDIKKNFRKSKRQSLDLNPRNNYKNKENIRTNNNNENNFLTENNNNNIITGENVNNINKRKNLEENKAHVNLRDIIKNENKNKNIFNTSKKEQKKDGLLLNYTKNKNTQDIISKQLKFYENKSQQNINSLVNLNCNKYKFNTHRNKKDNKSKTKPIFTNEKNSLAKINETDSSNIFKLKKNSIKKKSKLSNLEKNNTNNPTIIEKNNTQIIHTLGNKSPKIKQLTPLRSNKIDINLNNFSPNCSIKYNINKRINTISNKERNNKFKTFISDKTRSKSNCNSYKNFTVLNRMKSIKNNKKKASNNLNTEKLIKTPNINNKRLELFKKTKAITNNNFQNIKIKEREKNRLSYTIKVIKTYIKKKNNKTLLREKSKTKEKYNK
jgi:hypothetical protein